MDKEIIQYKNIASVIAIVMLLLAIPDIWPYGYYVVLRWVVVASALFLIWVSYEFKKQLWLVLMAMTAILFNPIVPIHLNKETWVIIDFVVAVLFLISIFGIKISEHKTK